MIFAAGLGKRLGDITGDRPKALVEIRGRSMLRIAVEYIASYGFDDIIVNVHHFADLVEEEIRMLRSEGFRITISDERDQLLETGGGLCKAKWFFSSGHFLLYNTDIVTDLNLKEMMDYHKRMRGVATLAVRKRKGNRYLLVDKDGILRGWRNISTGEEILTVSSADGLEEVGFSGIHISGPELLGSLREGIYSLTPLYLGLASSKNIFTFRHDSGLWWDIGTPSNLDEVRRNF